MQRDPRISPEACGTPHALGKPTAATALAAAPETGVGTPDVAVTAGATTVAAVVSAAGAAGTASAACTTGR